MTASLQLSAEARRDMIRIWRHIAVDNEKAADRTVASLDKAILKLCHMPEMGEPRDDLRPAMRKWTVGNYVILYRTRHNGVYIVRVADGRRDLNKLFP